MQTQVTIVSGVQVADYFLAKSCFQATHETSRSKSIHEL